MSRTETELRNATIIKEMTLDEFRERYMNKPDKYFNFDLFKITCRKCNSENVEFGGRSQNDSRHCWYPDDSPNVKVFLVCKCHDCGNAFVLMPDTNEDYVRRRDNTPFEDIFTGR